VNMLDHHIILDEGIDSWGPFAYADGYLIMRDSYNMVCLDISDPAAVSQTLSAEACKGSGDLQRQVEQDPQRQVEQDPKRQVEQDPKRQSLGSAPVK
ncbi:MAG: hypothetical protein RQ743_14055, partial [Bacteroidales bacterium]|nr:hypothetical protein [Bacteroidales bacterium]